MIPPLMGHNKRPVVRSANGMSSDDRLKLKGTIKELTESYTRMEAEKDLQKEAIESLCDDLGLDKKLVRRLSKTYFKANFNSEKEANSAFEEFYSLILENE